MLRRTFDAKGKENDEFVQKMKKEIHQAERRAKEKKLLEKQVQELLEAKKKDDAALAKLQSNLEKNSDLQSKEKEVYECELEKSRQMLVDAENYCASRFDVFSEKLAGEFNFHRMTVLFVYILSCRLVLFSKVYAVNPDAEKARLDEFSEIMKKDAYTPKSVRFAESLGLLQMRTTKAATFADEVMGATLVLENRMLLSEDNHVNLDSVVAFLQSDPQQFARWKRSSARSGANYALALTKAHFPDRVHNLERVSGGEPEQGPSCTTYLSHYAETASWIALLPDLDFFVESTHVESESDDACED